jgi:hypothetical protein
MNATLLVGIISALTALILGIASYSLNRRRDRDLEWRKLKLEHYREYIAALSGIAGRRSTGEGQARYSDAFNSLVLVAPVSVLKALYAFNDETRISNPARTPQRYEQLQNALIRELRRDVHPALGESSPDFFLIDATPALVEPVAAPAESHRSDGEADIETGPVGLHGPAAAFSESRARLNPTRR